MVDVTTYSEARQNLAKLMDRVVKDSEPVIVARRKRGSVVLVSLAEWNSIQETMQVTNARALMAAMKQLEPGELSGHMMTAALRAQRKPTRAKLMRARKVTKRRRNRAAKTHRATGRRATP
jgi:antitoxin YefM